MPTYPSSPDGAMRSIEEYDVNQVLGSGQHFEVRHAVDKSCQRAVALKKARSGFSPTSKTIAKEVKQELEALQRLKHPNIVALQTVVKHPTVGTALVLELCSKGELFDYIETAGAMDERLCRTVFKQLGAAVSHCHKNGVAHRDIKPEQILFSEDFTLKLADFGYAMVVPPSTSTSTPPSAPASKSVSSTHRTDVHTHTQCGTEFYMAPEVTEDHKLDEIIIDNDTSSGYNPFVADAWSVGVVLFIMLVGFPPFQQAHRYDKFFRFWKKKRPAYWKYVDKQCQLKHISPLSAEVRTVLEGLMDPCPSTRWTIKEALESKWAQREVLPHEDFAAVMRKRKPASP